MDSQKGSDAGNTTDLLSLCNFRSLPYIFLFLSWLATVGVSFGQTISTVAGGYLGDGQPATLGVLNQPSGVFMDGAGNPYIADRENNRVRKVDASGAITTVAGGGASDPGDGGPATEARLNSPFGLFVDASDNLYITESSRVRKVDPSGIITTVAGGGGESPGNGEPATEASLNRAAGICVDTSGNVYFSEKQGHRVRKVDASDIITTVAGNGNEGYSGDGGPATDAELGRPTGVFLDSAGNLYIADRLNFRIRKVDASGTITTVAGNGETWPPNDGGPATEAGVSWPSGLFVDDSDNLYIVGSERVRKVDASGIITTVAGGGSAFPGDGGPATDARFGDPTGVYVDDSGNVYIADTGHNRIRKVDASGVISTVAGGYIGDGAQATDANLTSPQGVVRDGDGNLYIADQGNNRIRKVDASGVMTTFAGGGSAGGPDYGDGAPATEASLSSPAGISLDSSGNVYIADTSHYRIRMVDASGTISTVAGGGNGDVGDGGPATEAFVHSPPGVYVDATGSIYIADRWRHRVRKVDASGTISTVAGNGSDGYSGDGGPATEASLSGPTGVVADESGNVYIVDYNNIRVRKVDASGVITTVVGNRGYGFSGDGGPASEANFSRPAAVFLDSSGNLYIADQDNNRIRKIDTSGIVTTVAGDGNAGFSGDGGPPTGASLRSPAGIFVDSSGDLYIADAGNHRIRKVSPPSRVIRLTADPDDITVGPEISTLRAEILDRDGNLVSDDNTTPVTFSIAGGEGRLSAVEVTVADGIATTNLTSSTVGTLTVLASANDAESASVSVTVSAPTRTIALTADPNTIAAAGSDVSTIQAQLLDLDGDLQSDDNTTVVAFRLTANTITGGEASLSAEEVTVSGGTATTALTGSMAGILTVEATARGAKGGTVSLTVRAETPIGPGGEPVSPGTGTAPISTVAGGYIGDGGPATDAALNGAAGLALDDAGNLYIADMNNHRIRKVDPSGTMTTVAGTGESGLSGDGETGTEARLNFPRDISVDSSGNLYIADNRNNRVRKLDQSSRLTTVAGGGSVVSGTNMFISALATEVELDGIRDITADPFGNVLFSENDRILKLEPSGLLSVAVGTGVPGFSGHGGPAYRAQLDAPNGILFDGAGNLFISDRNNHRIRKVDLSGIITTIAGTGEAGFSGDGGPALQAQLRFPSGISMDGTGNLFIADVLNHRIRRVDLSGTITTVAGDGTQTLRQQEITDGRLATEVGLDAPLDVAVDGDGNLYITDGDGAGSQTGVIRKIDNQGLISTVAGGTGSVV